MKTEFILSSLEAKHPGEKEYLQAVKEVLLSIEDVYNQHPEFEKNNQYALSEREMDIIQCLVKGDSYKMIADHCCITIGTVRTHINHIYRKLAVNSKSEVVIKAVKERLV